MRVMVIVKATAESEAGLMPSPALLEPMGRFNAGLAEAGVMEAGGGLNPTALGRRVAFDGDRRAVRDGPFAPVGEQIAGYWIWTVRDMDEAVAWVRRCPNPMPGPSEIEIRPLYEEADFADPGGAP
jgi:hypothetical protein